MACNSLTVTQNKKWGAINQIFMLVAVAAVVVVGAILRGSRSSLACMPYFRWEIEFIRESRGEGRG